jgi:predicted nucleotidyltransferase
MSAIRRFARQIAERFRPEKIILFGSYAYGKPHNESDVDLMVIMPARNVIDQAIRIRSAFERQFSADVHVRTPCQIKLGLKEDDCDWFLHEVMNRGKVLYEANHRPMGAEGRRRHGSGKKRGRKAATQARRSLLPLPTGSGKVLEGSDARTGSRRAANTRARRSP